MATANRKAAEAFILNFLTEVTRSDVSSRIHADMFSRMSDKEFEQYMEDIASGKRTLIAQEPNFTKGGISVKRNFALAKKYGINMHQRVVYGATDESPSHMTAVKFLVVKLPMIRVSQTVQKKRSIPPHNRSIDTLTGQPTGESKGAKISYPEAQILGAIGMEKSLQELMSVRGGDSKAFAALNGMIDAYGTASLETVARYGTGVGATKTMGVYLSSMHLANNVADNGKGPLGG